MKKRSERKRGREGTNVYVRCTTKQTRIVQHNIATIIKPHFFTHLGEQLSGL